MLNTKTNPQSETCTQKRASISFLEYQSRFNILNYRAAVEIEATFFAAPITRCVCNCSEYLHDFYSHYLSFMQRLVFLLDGSNAILRSKGQRKCHETAEFLFQFNLFIVMTCQVSPYVYYIKLPTFACPFFKASTFWLLIYNRFKTVTNFPNGVLNCVLAAAPFFLHRYIEWCAE